MKKSFTKVLLATAMFCVSPGASAYDFEVDGIYYNITSEADKTVEVTSGGNSYVGDVSIPATVENAGTIYTVTKIGDEAFSWCRNLKSINIPDGVTSIESGAFSYCSSLASIDIPDGVVSIGESAFDNCGSLESVTLGSGVETIGDYAFSYCRSLASIDIPDGVVSIGDEAFYFCGSLESVTLGSGVGTIGDYAFAYCSSLTEITCRATVPPVCGQDCFAYVDISNCTLSVPEGTEEAYKTADVWKEFFYEYFISGGIRYGAQTSPQGNIATVLAGEYTGDIAIPATVENGGVTYTVTEIGGRAFSECSDLVSVDIPAGVTSIGDYAFSDCSDLASIDIPDGVISIGERAFYYCNSLESVTLGRGLKTIGYEAFVNCDVLASIDIPDGVTSIGDYAFYGCGSLESVTLGSGVETIGDFAFSACRSLAEINSLATLPPACSSGIFSSPCFDGVDKNACTLNVPEGTADDYRAADGWKEFFNIVETDFAGSGEIAADAAAAAKVYAAAGRIVVENAAAGTPIAVYTADGVQVYGGAASDGRTEIPAQAGKLYIVRCGNAAYKTAM